MVRNDATSAFPRRARNALSQVTSCGAEGERLALPARSLPAEAHDKAGKSIDGEDRSGDVDHSVAVDRA